MRAPSPAAIRGALGPLFYVTAQPFERLPAGLARDAAATSLAVIVVPASVAPPGRGRPRLTVSGCVGFVLGAGRRPGAEPETARKAVA